MNLSCKKIFTIMAMLLFSYVSLAKEHIIYSVAQDLPMGYENEIVRKNYYLNLGSSQGIEKGSTLEVFRRISKSNPYDNKRRVNYKVKIGELEVLHTEQEAAIGIIKSFEKLDSTPLFEVQSFMIGDSVGVKVN